MTEPRLIDYLTHILTAIERISGYAAGLDAAGFATDERTQDAVIRNIEVIGEASRRIQARHPEFAVEHPELPLASAYQMRNAVAHGYFEVDVDIVWKTVVNDLPSLAELVRALLAAEN
ncbi:MAG: DUF86 domain-containing protein [Pseudolysinimonas sp.]